MKHQSSKSAKRKPTPAKEPELQQPGAKPAGLAGMGQKLLHGMGFAKGKQALSPAGGQGSLKEQVAPKPAAWQKGQTPAGPRGQGPQIGQREAGETDTNWQDFVAKQRAEREAELAGMGKRSTGQAPATTPEAKQARRDAATANVVKASADRAWVTQGGPLVGKEKHAKYQDEDKQLGWRTSNEDDKGLDTITTRYERSAEARDASQVKVGAGGKLDTAQGGGDKSTLGYVMDPTTGKLHTFDPARIDVVGEDGSLTPDQTSNFRMHRAEGRKLQTTHHTTPLAGAAVAGAGMVELKDGAVKQISDESGHYAPTAEHTHQTVRTMAEQGLALQRPAMDEDGNEGVKSAKVKLTGYDQIRGQGKGWLGEHADKGMYQKDLELPYQAFLQTHGNEAQARFKKGAGKELLSKRSKTKAHKPAPMQQAKGGDLAGQYITDGNTHTYSQGESENYIYDAPAPQQPQAKAKTPKAQNKGVYLNGGTYTSGENYAAYNYNSYNYNSYNPSPDHSTYMDDRGNVLPSPPKAPVTPKAQTPENYSNSNNYSSSDGGLFYTVEGSGQPSAPVTKAKSKKAKRKSTKQAPQTNGAIYYGGQEE